MSDSNQVQQSPITLARYAVNARDVPITHDYFTSNFFVRLMHVVLICRFINHSWGVDAALYVHNTVSHHEYKLSNVFIPSRKYNVVNYE
jgi:hypothetical protein